MVQGIQRLKKLMEEMAAQVVAHLINRVELMEEMVVLIILTQADMDKGVRLNVHSTISYMHLAEKEEMIAIQVKTELIIQETEETEVVVAGIVFHAKNQLTEGLELQFYIISNINNMDNYLYIQKDAVRIYVPMPEELDTVNYEVGTTWEDYVAGKYVLLTEEQIAFKEANEGASVEEVFNMQLTPIPKPTPEEKLQTAKDLKRQEVYNTDYRHYYIEDNDVYTYDLSLIHISEPTRP